MPRGAPALDKDPRKAFMQRMPDRLQNVVDAADKLGDGAFSEEEAELLVPVVEACRDDVFSRLRERPPVGVRRTSWNKFAKLVANLHTLGSLSGDSYDYEDSYVDNMENIVNEAVNDGLERMTSGPSPSSRIDFSFLEDEEGEDEDFDEEEEDDED